VDGRVLLFTAVATTATALIFGLLPALQATRIDLVSGLRASASVFGRSRLRGALLVVQVALSFVLPVASRRSGLTGIGALLGAALAIAVTRLMSGLLYGLSPTDPVTFAGTAGVLLLVTVAVGYLATRQGVTRDPVALLRPD
jgi:ABC-type antimicrobial peptide transport system permease subunit